MTLALKTAILVGVAYAGWQWLQSRQQSDRWSAPDYSSPPPPSTSSDGTGPSTSGAYRSAV
jgi:hypothetical protein